MENYCRISPVVGQRKDRKWNATLSFRGFKGKFPSLFLYFSPSSFFIICRKLYKWWRAVTGNLLVHKINSSLDFLSLPRASLTQG